MIQKGARRWKRFLAGGEGKLPFGASQYWPGLRCGGVSLSFSFGDSLDECLGLLGAAQFAMISLLRLILRSWAYGPLTVVFDLKSP